jgi:hypothetical protein
MPAGRGGRLARTLAASLVSLAALFALPSFAHAASVLGSYGDKDGCRYAKTGESSGSDSFVLLNDEGITTSTAFCAFAAPLRATSKGFEGMATCESSGESGEPGKVRITKGAKGYTVAFDDGTRWGPLPKCR